LTDCLDCKIHLFIRKLRKHWQAQEFGCGFLGVVKSPVRYGDTSLVSGLVVNRNGVMNSSFNADLTQGRAEQIAIWTADNVLMKDVTSTGISGGNDDGNI
jgi:hypothetical protein